MEINDIIIMTSIYSQVFIIEGLTFLPQCQEHKKNNQKQASNQSLHLSTSAGVLKDSKR